MLKRKERELKKVRCRYIKARQRKAGRGKRLAFLFCIGLAAAWMILFWECRENLLFFQKEIRTDILTDQASYQKPGGGETSAESQEPEKEIWDRFGIILRPGDGEITFYHEKERRSEEESGCH